MNERIKLLAEQCTEIVTGIDEVEFFDKEKFAELIVRECAELVDWAIGDKILVGTIKQHFGVE